MTRTEQRYDARELEDFGTALLQWGGLPGDRARVTAKKLIAADLMGHVTHGLMLCGPYIKQYRTGAWQTGGEIETVSDRGATVLWDAHFLPGLWVTDCGVRMLLERVEQHGIVTLSIRRNSHIGCLQTFLPAATEQGCMILLSCSDQNTCSVAPFGGIDPVLTPNPIAVGIPTSGDPILADFTTSITNNGRVMQAIEQDEPMPGPWLLTADGDTTDDPNCASTDPAGTILPLGGLDCGHKGFALSLMVEALTQALSGFGRADDREGWSAEVFIQVISPDAFAGRDQFVRQVDRLVQLCSDSRVRPDCDEIRLPGQNALAKQRDMLANGVILAAPVLASMQRYAGESGIAFPEPCK